MPMCCFGTHIVPQIQIPATYSKVRHPVNGFLWTIFYLWGFIVVLRIVASNISYLIFSATLKCVCYSFTNKETEAK